MTLQVQEGRHYRRLDGKVTGPMRHNQKSDKFPWRVGYDSYTNQGKIWSEGTDSLDLIEECNADGSAIGSNPTNSQLEYELRCTRDGYDEMERHALKLEAENARLLKENAALALALHREEDFSQRRLEEINHWEKIAGERAFEKVDLARQLDKAIAWNVRLEAQVAELTPKPVVTSVWRNTDALPQLQEQMLRLSQQAILLSESAAVVATMLVAPIENNTCNGVTTATLEEI